MSFGDRVLYRLRRLRFWLVLTLALLVALVGIIGAADWLTRDRVTLDVSGQVMRIHTRAETVQQVLDNARVLIDTEDIIWPAPTTRVDDGMTIVVQKAVAVALEVDGEVRQIRTQVANPLDILDEQAVELGPHDRLSVDGREIVPETLKRQDWERPPSSIIVRRSVTLKVADSTGALVIHTTEADVGGALDGAGLELYLADAIIPDPGTPVRDGMTIQIERSAPITLVADGQALTTRALGPTVADALAAVGLAPLGKDYTVPPLNALVEPGMVVRLVRVTEELVIEEKTVPFMTVYRAAPDLPAGERQVIEPGTTGLRQQRVLVRYEDGLETSRTLQDARMIDPPAARLILFGTRSSTSDE